MKAEIEENSADIFFSESIDNELQLPKSSCETEDPLFDHFENVQPFQMTCNVNSDRKIDEIDQFFATLAATSKKFSRTFQVKVKREISTLMWRLEEEWLSSGANKAN